MPEQSAAELAAAWNNYGNDLDDRGDLLGAVQSYQTALQWTPNCPYTHYNLARALNLLGRAEEAVAFYRRAVALKPDYASAYNNLGNVLETLDRGDEAQVCYREALRLQPADFLAHGNLGNCLAGRQNDEALACFDRSLALSPAHGDAHVHRGLLLLMLGRLREGWPEYEWRWFTRAFAQHAHRRILIDGGMVVLSFFRATGYHPGPQFVSGEW